MNKLDNDLISRKALLEGIKEIQAQRNGCLPQTGSIINLIKDAPTIEAEMFPSEGLQKALENYKKPASYPVCDLTKEELYTPFGVNPIKPTIEAASGEAVAWMNVIDEALVVAHIGVANICDTYDEAKSKLYSLIGLHIDIATDPKVNGGFSLQASPPKREWKSLSDEQTNECWDIGKGKFTDIAKAIDSKLKELNHG